MFFHKSSSYDANRDSPKLNHFGFKEFESNKKVDEINNEVILRGDFVFVKTEDTKIVDNHKYKYLDDKIDRKNRSDKNCLCTVWGLNKYVSAMWIHINRMNFPQRAVKIFNHLRNTIGGKKMEPAQLISFLFELLEDRILTIKEYDTGESIRITKKMFEFDELKYLSFSGFESIWKPDGVVVSKLEVNNFYDVGKSDSAQIRVRKKGRIDMFPLTKDCYLGQEICSYMARVNFGPIKIVLLPRINSVAELWYWKSIIYGNTEQEARIIGTWAYDNIDELIDDLEDDAIDVINFLKKTHFHTDSKIFNGNLSRIYNHEFFRINKKNFESLLDEIVEKASIERVEYLKIYVDLEEEIEAQIKAQEVEQYKMTIRLSIYSLLDSDPEAEIPDSWELSEDLIEEAEKYRVKARKVLEKKRLAIYNLLDADPEAEMPKYWVISKTLKEEVERYRLKLRKERKERKEKGKVEGVIEEKIKEMNKSIMIAKNELLIIDKNIREYQNVKIKKMKEIAANKLKIKRNEMKKFEIMRYEEISPKKIEATNTELKKRNRTLDDQIIVLDEVRNKEIKDYETIKTIIPQLLKNKEELEEKIILRESKAEEGKVIEIRNKQIEELDDLLKKLESGIELSHEPTDKELEKMNQLLEKLKSPEIITSSKFKGDPTDEYIINMHKYFSIVGSVQILSMNCGKFVYKHTFDRELEVFNDDREVLAYMGLFDKQFFKQHPKIGNFIIKESESFFHKNLKTVHLC